MSKVFRDFEMQWLIDETKKNIVKELDFLQEGQNAEREAKLFENYKWLKVPKIFWDYSTERVLVMEYVSGGQVNDVKYIDQLSDRFTYHYSKLWLSIIDQNRDEMKVHAEELGIPKELYGLFACMVTGRPWVSIKKGIGLTRPTSDDKLIIQNELPNMLHYVTQCLEQVDRQALLVRKTNDLIRSIEYALGMQDRMCGFVIMSQCCIQSVYNLEYQNQPNVFKRSFLNLKFGWSLVLLYFYSLYQTLHFKLSFKQQTIFK